jgi:hypothetical protein
MTAPSLPHLRFLVRVPMPIGSGLARGWRQTVYEAAGEDVRLGRRSRGVDALLRRAGVREAAFTGAWNPFSRRRPRAWNEAMLERLRGLARRAHLPFLEGRGSALRPAWCEQHLLLLGAWRRAAVLARRFRQHAILRVRRGAPSRLLVLR